MQVLNRRVRDDIPLTPTEYAAWRHWSGLPPLPSSSSGKRKKKKEEEADEEDMHFGFHVFGFQAHIVEYMSFSCYSGSLFRFSLLVGWFYW